MPFDWKAIEEISHPETRLYRLIGEMLRSRANIDDLRSIALFLQRGIAGADAWRTVGEALHTTTKGGTDGLRLWVAWSKALAGVTSDEDELEMMWRRFGGELIVVEDPPTDEMDSTSVDLGDSQVSHTAVLSFTGRTLMQYLPEGSYSIRFLDEEFHGVDEFSIITLLKRGILLGSEVFHQGEWVPLTRHPDFALLSRVMRDEVRRVLERNTLEITSKKNHA